MNKHHLGIIPDGNRRWARQNHTSYYSSYILGLKKLVDIFELAFNNSIDEISVYCLSKENLNRNSDDLNAAIKSQVDFINTDLAYYQKRKGVKIKGIGETILLPIEYQNAISEIENFGGETNFAINLLVAYNPFYEIYHAVRHSEINDPNDLLKHLTVSRKVDLLIRTAGGKCPLSNFLPLQCGYASVFITDTFLNDLTEGEIIGIFEEFNKISPKIGL